MIEILLYIYIAGIVIGALVECYNFSCAIKTLSSTGGFFFMLTHVIIEVSKYFVWPVVLPLRLIQLLFLNSAIDDFNESMANYNGYSKEDNNDEKGDS